MKRTVPRLEGPARALAKSELIGLACTVADARDKGLVGLSGDVVGETLRTLTLRVGGPGGRRIRLGKVGCTFEFAAPGGPVRIPGAAIEYRPEERTKKVR